MFPTGSEQAHRHVENPVFFSIRLLLVVYAECFPHMLQNVTVVLGKNILMLADSFRVNYSALAKKPQHALG